MSVRETLVQALADAFGPAGPGEAPGSDDVAEPVRVFRSPHPDVPDAGVWTDGAVAYVVVGHAGRAPDWDGDDVLPTAEQVAQRAVADLEALFADRVAVLTGPAGAATTWFDIPEGASSLRSRPHYLPPGAELAVWSGPLPAEAFGGVPALPASASDADHVQYALDQLARWHGGVLLAVTEPDLGGLDAAAVEAMSEGERRALTARLAGDTALVQAEVYGSPARVTGAMPDLPEEGTVPDGDGPIPTLTDRERDALSALGWSLHPRVWTRAWPSAETPEARRAVADGLVAVLRDALGSEGRLRLQVRLYESVEPASLFARGIDDLHEEHQAALRAAEPSPLWVALEPALADAFGPYEPGTPLGPLRTFPAVHPDLEDLDVRVYTDPDFVSATFGRHGVYASLDPEDPSRSTVEAVVAEAVEKMGDLFADRTAFYRTPEGEAGPIHGDDHEWYLPPGTAFTRWSGPVPAEHFGVPPAPGGEWGELDRVRHWLTSIWAFGAAIATADVVGEREGAQVVLHGGGAAGAVTATVDVIRDGQRSTPFGPDVREELAALGWSQTPDPSAVGTRQWTAEWAALGSEAARTGAAADVVRVLRDTFGGEGPLFLSAALDTAPSAQNPLPPARAAGPVAHTPPLAAGPAVAPPAAEPYATRPLAAGSPGPPRADPAAAEPRAAEPLAAASPERPRRARRPPLAAPVDAAPGAGSPAVPQSPETQRQRRRGDRGVGAALAAVVLLAALVALAWILLSG